MSRPNRPPTRTEFIVAMLKLREHAPHVYEQLKAEARLLKAEAWELVAEAHRGKSPEQLAEWMRGAS